MSTVSLVVLWLSPVALLGLCTLIHRWGSLREKRVFVNQHQKYFKVLSVGNVSAEQEEYLITRLSRQAPKINELLGPMGVGTYAAPFSAFQITNYPLLLNTVAQLRTGTVSDSEIQQCISLLDSLIGKQDDRNDALWRQLINPAVWFREGVQFILTSPFRMLFLLGLLRPDTFDSLNTKPLVKVISSILAVIGFLGEIITIVVGWTPFLNILHSIFR